MPYTDRKLIVLSLKWYDFRIHQGVLDYAKNQKWDVMASHHMSLALDIPEADGQIVMLGPNDQRRTRLVEKSLTPSVDLANHSSLDLPRVYPDNIMAGEMAAEEFLSKGFENFVVFSTQSHWYVDDRRKGFQLAVEKQGFSCEHWHMPQTDFQKGSFAPKGSSQISIEKRLTEAEKPLAIFTIEDEGAALLMRTCHQMGLAVPEQVSLIGTNNDPVICPYTEVPLSSVDLNWKEVGFTAAAQLDRLMQHQPLDQNSLSIPPKGLVSRKSSNTLAIDDLRVARGLSYILENSHRHLSVTEIAEAVGVPLRTLQWAFQKSLHCSIQDEVSKKRILQIKDLLLHSDRKIGQIAKDLHFSSAQYMNHFFAKAMELTPNEYRQNKQANLESTCVSP